jgi:hypothetical protein
MAVVILKLKELSLALDNTILKVKLKQKKSEIIFLNNLKYKLIKEMYLDLARTIIKILFSNMVVNKILAMALALD